MACKYFKRGYCKFGTKCRYQHDIGDPMECQYFKRGYCKFPDSCKKIHINTNTGLNLTLCLTRKIEYAEGTFDYGGDTIIEKYYTKDGCTFYNHRFRSGTYSQECIKKEEFLQMTGKHGIVAIDNFTTLYKLYLWYLAKILPTDVSIGIFKHFDIKIPIEQYMPLWLDPKLWVDKLL